MFDISCTVTNIKYIFEGSCNWDKSSKFSYPVTILEY